MIVGSGIKHAMCCIDAITLLKKKCIHEDLSAPIILVPDESRWPLLLHDNLLPPTITGAAGRPQTKRREDGERKPFKRSTSVRCSSFDEWGHNVRSCKSITKAGKNKKLVNHTVP